MSIPTDITYTDLTANFDLNPVSSRNFAVDLQTSGGVNTAINSFKGQMLDQQWTLTGEYFASTTLTVAGLSGSSITGHSHTVLNWTGVSVWDYQFFKAPEPDPSGGPGLLPGTFIGGIESAPGDGQIELIGKLAARMQLDSLYPLSVVAISDDVIRITSTAPGPQYNDLGWVANISGGYIFNGSTKGGGWELTSLSTVEHSPVTVSLINDTSQGFLSIYARINGHDCTPIVMQSRNNYLSVVSPFMWALFHLNDGTTWDSGVGGGALFYDNYLICAPEMDAVQLADPDDPLTFAAFVLIQDRTNLNQAGYSTTAINGSFHDAGFFPFDSDMGISLLLLNSMQTAAGALTTTSDKYLQIQALIGLSPDAGEALQVVGPIWDTYLVSKYFPLDTLAIGYGGKLVIAYRSQQAPCEWTLWLALN